MRRSPRAARWITVLGWLIFTAGLLSFAFLYLRHTGSTIPKVNWKSRWGRPHPETFQDPEGQFLLDYPSDWDMSAPFERFTRHRVGSLVALDTMALRHANPTGLLVVIRYLAPQPMPAPDWLALTRPPGPLADVFGEKILSRAPARLAGHAALHVVAQGLLTEQLYRLESWFVPDGADAYRITIGAPVAKFALAAPALHRIVASFRFTVGGRRVSELTRRH